MNEKGQLLLQQRNKEPEKGYWSIPGGKLEWMETQHWVSPSFLCKIIEGEPKIMEPTKHTDMQWFDLHTLPENLTITTKHAVRAYTKTHVNEKQK